MADFRLLDRQVVDNILKFREEGLFLRGIVQWVGYPSDQISFTVQERHSGVPKYSFAKMLRLAWTGISSFSTVPLRIGIFLGLFTSVGAFAWMFWAVWARYYGEYFVPGWASALAITTFLFGILFMLLGIIGDYIGRILIEVKGRPRYLISESVGPGADSNISDRSSDS
jgi:dolichol-phosphate mannosyltransferase